MRLLAVLSLLAAAPASADVFDRVSGVWGLFEDPALSCEVNPHRITFNPERTRAHFAWAGPMVNYKGNPDEEADYTVLAHTQTSITLALDNEERRTSGGKPVIWVLRLQEDGGKYCWGRTDWSRFTCIDTYYRCDAPAPTS